LRCPFRFYEEAGFNEESHGRRAAGQGRPAVERCHAASSVDSKGILCKDREDRGRLQSDDREKWDLCLKTNPKNLKGQIPDAIKGRDVLVCVPTPGPGTIKPEWIKTMARDAIVFDPDKT
jgi:malic enzyme